MPMGGRRGFRQSRVDLALGGGVSHFLVVRAAAWLDMAMPSSTASTGAPASSAACVTKRSPQCHPHATTATTPSDPHAPPNGALGSYQARRGKGESGQISPGISSINYLRPGELFFAGTVQKAGTPTFALAFTGAGPAYTLSYVWGHHPKPEPVHACLLADELASHPWIRRRFTSPDRRGSRRLWPVPNRPQCPNPRVLQQVHESI